MKCKTCDKELGNEKALDQHIRSKHPETLPKEKKVLSPQIKKKLKNWIVVLTILIVLIGGPVYLLLKAKTLPPTTMEGHVEDSPVSHVMKQPIPDSVQKHMLEHSDGKGRPGVIINYDCGKYDCDFELIPKLEKFAETYDYVYVAPYPGMDVKIALTALNKIKVLEEYDEAEIQRFIDLS